MGTAHKTLATFAPRLLIIAVLALAVTLSEQAAAQGKKKVIRLEAIKVEGRIQKPQAFYILQRSNLSFEGMEFNQSFLPMILESVERHPF